ncbi:GTPase-activating protein [Rhizopus stolonifer]|uniref:GTPase-activating protein n=1 Tax=Rhizopus stolonifer TaxID=4846 RepID=A0A367KUN4_RHIST|nr:GTPase-activating protein [Rhizopus stolonifer]
MTKPINDFDLNVLDEAMLQPEKSEYVDHFGFTIQVKTENDTDSSEDESEHETEFEDAQSIPSSTKEEEEEEQEENKRQPQTMDDWQMVSSTEKSGVSSSVSSPIPHTTSYYDLLLSKFTRTASSNPSKQVQLRQETSNNLERLKEQSNNNETDWEFWASVISDFERINRAEHAKLQEQLSVGIPSSLRGMLWRIFSNSEANSDLIENEYRVLLEKTSSHEKLIRRDLSRTFPTLPYFKEKDGEGQEMLFNVIKAYSLFDSQMPDEAAFCVLIKLMSQYHLRGHFTPQMETLHERMFQFNQLLSIHLPQVHRHLDAQGVLPTMYASQWFMTLFAYRCPLELVFRVFDLVFVEGSDIMLNFALALMKKNQSTILSLEFESLLDFFSGQIFEVYKDMVYEFVQDAYSFDISSKQLAKFSKQYQQEAAKEAKLRSIQDAIKKENLVLHGQVKKLRHAYKTLEFEHQDVSQQVIESKVAMASLDIENQQLKHELAIMKAEMVKMTSVMNEERQAQFDALAQKNAELVDANAALEDRLQEIESILIEMKLKYAESENDYELMKQKLHEAQKLSMLHD